MKSRVDLDRGAANAARQAVRALIERRRIDEQTPYDDELLAAAYLALCLALFSDAHELELLARKEGFWPALPPEWFESPPAWFRGWIAPSAIHLLWQRPGLCSRSGAER